MMMQELHYVKNARLLSLAEHIFPVRAYRLPTLLNRREVHEVTRSVHLGKFNVNKMSSVSVERYVTS